MQGYENQTKTQFLLLRMKRFVKKCQNYTILFLVNFFFKEISYEGPKGQKNLNTNKPKKKNFNFLLKQLEKVNFSFYVDMLTC